MEKGLENLIHEIRASRAEPTKLVRLIKLYDEEYGPKAEGETLKIIADFTRESWAGIAEDHGDTSIQGILDTLWNSFKNAGGEFTVERFEDGVQIYCTKCPMADTYKEIGKQGHGLIFHCSTDPHIVEGFNDNIDFKITKRLMSGDDCCDHRYSIKKK